MGGACSVYEGEERRVEGLVGKPEGRRPLGRPRSKWEDFFFPMPPHVLMNIRGFPPGCGDSVADV